MHWDAGRDNIIGSDRISLPTPGLSVTLTLGLLQVSRHSTRTRSSFAELGNMER
jgi:hypothetical protein